MCIKAKYVPHKRLIEINYYTQAEQISMTSVTQT